MSSDFTYKGAVVTDNWPAASRVAGATRPAYERWTATFSDLTQIHAFTQAEIKAAITTLKQEVAK